MPEEIHPYFNKIEGNSKIAGGFLPENMEILIVGTFPPYQAPHVNFFFYPSPQNHFWNRMDNIFCNTPGFKPLKYTARNRKSEWIEDNIQRKKEFSIKHKIGFLDCFSKVIRNKENSNDADIDIDKSENIINTNKLDEVIENFKSLKRICCTYSLAHRVILQQQNYKIELFNSPLTADGNIIKLGNKIELVLLYPATRSKHKGELKDKQYKYFLFDKQ